MTHRRTCRHPAGHQSGRLLPAGGIRREDEDQGLEQAASFPGARKQRRDQMGEPGNLLRRIAGGDEAGSSAARRGNLLQIDWQRSLLEASAKDQAVKATLTEAAIAAERDLIEPLFLWRNNGGPVGNGWNTQVNAAQWGTDYLKSSHPWPNRACTAMGQMKRNTTTRTTIARARSSPVRTPMPSLSRRDRCLRFRGSGRSPC